MFWRWSSGIKFYSASFCHHKRPPNVCCSTSDVHLGSPEAGAGAGAGEGEGEGEGAREEWPGIPQEKRERQIFRRTMPEQQIRPMNVTAQSQEVCIPPSSTPIDSNAGKLPQICSIWQPKRRSRCNLSACNLPAIW